MWFSECSHGCVQWVLDGFSRGRRRELSLGFLADHVFGLGFKRVNRVFIMVSHRGLRFWRVLQEFERFRRYLQDSFEGETLRNTLPYEEILTTTGALFWGSEHCQYHPFLVPTITTV